MGKVGTWTYWFKALDGVDISYTRNKNDIPKGYKYVQHFIVHKPDGNHDDEIIDNGKVVWVQHNTNKLSRCDNMNLAVEIQKKLHELLDVKYPDSAYTKVFKKIIKKENLKDCKLK